MLGVTPLRLYASLSASLISTLLIMTDECSRIKGSTSYVNYDGRRYFYRPVFHRTTRLISFYIVVSSSRFASRTNTMSINAPLCERNVTRVKTSVVSALHTWLQDSPRAASYTRNTNFGVNDRGVPRRMKSFVVTRVRPGWCALILSPSSSSTL